MDRPYVICHMTTSLNGKVTGAFLTTEAGEKACQVYYEVNRNYKAEAFACGRVTMESSFTGGWYPDLSLYEEIAGSDDFVPQVLPGRCAVAFDPHGRLGWKSNRIIDADEDPAYDKAPIIEVLTRQVDGRYLGYLQAMEIPYIFAGEKAVDVTLALKKLNALFGIQTLLLEGGSVLNGAFARENLIDELSLVQCPMVAETEDKPLFEESNLAEFELAQMQLHEGGVLWLNYKKI